VSFWKHGPLLFQYTLRLPCFAQSTIGVGTGVAALNAADVGVAASLVVGAAREPPKTMTSTAAIAIAPARKVTVVR
jgi:hypothetical protein